MKLCSFVTFLTLLTAPFAVASSSTSDESPKSPEDTVHALFKGMYDGDGAAIEKLMDVGATMNRVGKDGVVSRGTPEKWIAWVSAQSKGDANEQIYAVKTLVAGPLATVWAPFELTFKGKFVGCGVNLIVLNNHQQHWKIASVADTHLSDDLATCAQIKAQAVATE